MSTFAAFLLAAIVLAMTPGPGMAYVVARTVAGGRKEGLASCLGTALGGLLHVLAATMGMSLLLTQSAMAFGVVKYAGAVCLVYLGARMLLRRSVQAQPVLVTCVGTSRAFAEGMLVEALNVKTALFFLAFLPQFVLETEPVDAQLAMLGSICVALNTAADLVAVCAADRLLQSSTARAARTRLLTGISGATMIGLGVLLAMANRKA